MMHAPEVRDLARAVVEIAEVDVPAAGLTDDMIVEEPTGRDWYEVEQDGEWWDAWCEIHAIVRDRVADPDISANEMRPDIEPHRRHDGLRATTDHVSLSVKVYADGHVRILAEYDDGRPAWSVLHEDHAEAVDAIDIGREVAAAELTLLASATGSCAAALDYWQTQERPRPPQQRVWAEMRGVNRQTVSDRVAETRDILDGQEGPDA